MRSSCRENVNLPFPISAEIVVFADRRPNGLVVIVMNTTTAQHVEVEPLTIKTGWRTVASVGKAVIYRALEQFGSSLGS